MKRRILLIAAVIVGGIGVTQAVGAQGVGGPSIGPVPDTGDGALTAKVLPDLIPLVDTDGDVIGYLRSDELFVDVLHPEREFVATGVYEADGETLIGYEVPGEGFVATTKPRETSRLGVVPEAQPRIDTGQP